MMQYLFLEVALQNPTHFARLLVKPVKNINFEDNLRYSLLHKGKLNSHIWMIMYYRKVRLNEVC